MRILPIYAFLSVLILAGCGREQPSSSVPVPTEIIDLGVLITEDTPRQFWGTKMLQDLNFTESNSFRVINWKFGPVSGSNSYYTFFNHGGPHVDAPNHIGVDGDINDYSINAFAGPLKVFDFSHLDTGWTITLEMLTDRQIAAGDIVIIYTGYKAPSSDSDWPKNAALTYEAAKYLADLPVRAIGTDAFNVEGPTDQSPPGAENEIAKTIPGHYAFLTRGIPVYEQLVNVDSLLGKKNLYFVGVPLNVENGDGMIVRPVVLVY